MDEDLDSELLCQVLVRFPGAAGRIRELFQSDEQFRELCADYAECSAALRRFRTQSTSVNARIQQYTELLASLEQELRVSISGTARR